MIHHANKKAAGTGDGHTRFLPPFLSGFVQNQWIMQAYRPAYGNQFSKTWFIVLRKATVKTAFWQVKAPNRANKQAPQEITAQN